MYRRVLIKISGEVLGGGKNGLDYGVVKMIAEQLAECHHLGTEIGVVIGGGNIIRGVDAEKYGIKRITADYMGMLSTVVNSLALQSILEEHFNIPTRVMSAISIPNVVEDFVQRKAINHLEKRNIVIFAGGTGNPFFSTDTASALRAIEMNANIMIKATKVNGVYDKDPAKFCDAVKYDKLTYMNILTNQLKVIDASAISLCMENNLPVIIMDIFEKGNIIRAISGATIGTLIH